MQPSAGNTQDDLQRPRYHFLPPEHWLNDPNGLIQWNGEYHMFYQYNPNGPFHGTIHWGHAVSTDLVHWEHLPVALAPDPDTVDEDGCWSGAAVNNNGVPTLIYSGNRDGVQRPCIATSRDNLRTWQKHANNPVIVDIPPDLHLVEYRDHSIWREGDTWYQLIGAGLEGQGGTVLLYRSADLYTWEYIHPLLVGDARRFEPVWTGTMWECPDFFALGDKHVLIISVWDKNQLHYSAALAGSYRDHHFAPEIEHKLDYGNHHFYAPQSFTDDQGRRIIFGWMHEGCSGEQQNARGWSGMMSLPRVLAFGPDGHVCMQPVPELEALRTEHTSSAACDLLAGQIVELASVQGDAMELAIELAPAPAGRTSVIVRRTPDGTEHTHITYDATQHQLILDRTRSSLDPTTDHNIHVAPLLLDADEPLQLRIFLDRSAIEVFANERVTITSRIYPTRPDSTGVALLTENGDARLLQLDAWQMKGI